MTPQQLKNAILHLAITGKLLDQNERRNFSKENAADLLNAIQQERETLIKEKKLKKTKPLSPITDEEKPFEIPENWVWVRLENICERIIDGDHNPPKGEVLETKFLMLSSQNINFDQLVHIEKARYLNEELFKKADQRTNVKKGDVLLTTVGTLGRSCVYEGGYNLTFQRSVSIIRTLIFNQYLKRFFDCPAFQNKIVNEASGTAQKGFYLNQLKQVPIPLPPLAEQKAIVEKLEKILPAIETYAEKYQLLKQLDNGIADKLKKSLLQQAVTGKLLTETERRNFSKENTADLLNAIQQEKETQIKEKKLKKTKPLSPITDEEKPFEIPENWVWVRLGEIGYWRSGATPVRTNSAFYGGKIAWLKTGDLNDGFIYETSETITELALSHSSVKLIPKNSVLMAMYGATIGKLGISKIEMTTNQACCACTPFTGVDYQFLFYFLLAMRDEFIKMGAGGAQPNISREKIINTSIPLPPLAEQKAIVEKLDKLLPNVERLQGVLE